MVRKDKYELICAVDTQEKENVTMPGDVSSGVGIPMPSKLSKEALTSLGHTMEFNR